MSGEWSGLEDCGYWEGASRRCKLDIEVQERSAPFVLVKVRTRRLSVLKPLQSLPFAPVMLVLVSAKIGLKTVELTSSESHQFEPQ